MTVRDQLLTAAARLYAEAGYRGATTRRIAQEAGVNEITLFRHFGSKETLLHEAIARAGAELGSVALPEVPSDPERELAAWARAQLTHMVDRRSLIRTCMGEMEEHPDIISSIDKPPVRAAAALAAYLSRLRQRKLATAPFDERVAAAMLMGTLFGDAMGRDMMPELFTRDTDASLREYVRLLLRGIGVRLVAVLLPLLLAAAPLAAQATGAPARGLSLTEALELAERGSESVGIARADVARERGERRQARSGYFPQLSASASYQRTLQSQFSALRSDDTTSSEPARECDRFVAQPGLSVDERLDALEGSVECSSAADPFAGLRNLPFGRENTYRFGLSATQNLFTGGRLRGLSQAAEAELRSAELGLTSAQAQTLFDVTQAYYDATLGDRLVAIAEATLRQADTTLTQAQLAKDVGNQSEFELLRARVTRDNQRPVVIRSRADRDLAYVRLKQLLDLPLAQPLALSTELSDSTLAGAPRLAALVPAPEDTIVDRRIGVRQAAEAVAFEAGQLRVARSQRRPQVTLSSDFAELGYPGEVSPVGTDYVSDWTVSLALSLPLFTGGRIRGEVEAARAGVAQAELRLQQTRERAALDARSARLELEAAVAAWEASAGTEAQAERAYQIAELRYREGISTQTELNELRIQLAQAQSTRARAARDLQLARIRQALLPVLPLASATGAGGATNQ